MKTEYTTIRRIYAWVGFVAIPLALILAGYIAFGYADDKCIASDTLTPYEPILDVVEQPKTVLIATSTAPTDLDYVEKEQIVRTIYANVTGYNTVPEQTDDTPCIAADGSYVCDRFDTVACPTYLELGSNVMIYGRIYECVDRTNSRHDGKFDINCNKDFDCPAMVTSFTKVHILD